MRVTAVGAGGALTGAVLAAAAGVAGQGTAVSASLAAIAARRWSRRSRATGAAGVGGRVRQRPTRWSVAIRPTLVVTAEALTRDGLTPPWQAVVSAAAWSRIEDLAPAVGRRAAWTRCRPSRSGWRPARRDGDAVGGAGRREAGVRPIPRYRAATRPHLFLPVASVSAPRLPGRQESVEHRDATRRRGRRRRAVEVRAGTTAATSAWRARVRGHSTPPLPAAWRPSHCRSHPMAPG